MTVENISWSISTKECCRPRRGLNPRPPGLQSDGASNWATEAGCRKKKRWGKFYTVTKPTQPFKPLMHANRRTTVATVVGTALTHYILNRFSHTIYWKSPISILGKSDYKVYIFLEKKGLNYLQTVETLIRRHILRHLIWVCTVCQLPFLWVSRLQWVKMVRSKTLSECVCVRERDPALK